jgi:hypothetical protein
MILAGLPATVGCGGTSLVTLPAPTIALSAAIADPTLLNFDEGSDLRCIAKSGS